MNDLNNEVEGEIGAPPCLRVEQLKAQHLELEEARLQLEQERTELNREIERHGDGGRVHAMAHDMHRRIIADDEALPRFSRASQNIATVAALLRGLLGPTTLKDRQGDREIHMILERTAAQQAESLLSR